MQDINKRAMQCANWVSTGLSYCQVDAQHNELLALSCDVAQHDTHGTLASDGK